MIDAKSVLEEMRTASRVRWEIFDANGESSFLYEAHGNGIQQMITAVEENISREEMPELQEELGLTVDMLDVDRLRAWAHNLETYGSDVTHWSSVSFMIEHLKGCADRLEKAVHDIGKLRRLLRK